MAPKNLAGDDTSSQSKSKINKKSRSTQLKDTYGIGSKKWKHKDLPTSELDKKENSHSQALRRGYKAKVSTRKRFINFWKKLPGRIWNFYIEALIIPGYRKEWGKYNSWSFKSLSRKVLNTEERFERAKVSRRKRIVSHVKLAGGPSIPHIHTDCERVTFNVTGRRFQTQVRTLKQYPDTLLGDPAQRFRYYDPVKDEYFFDRHRTSFEAILHFFQSGGELVRPITIPIKVFEDEIRFFGLGDEVTKKFREEEGLILDSEKSLPTNLLQRKLWLLIEYPESSKNARLVSVLSIFVIVLSIFVFCLETVPHFQLTISAEGVLDRVDISDPFFLVETVCIIWFCTEIIIRMAVCPSKSNFIRNFMNIIDFVAILPYFSTIIAVNLEGGSDVGAKTSLLGVLRVIRLVRVFRIFKLSRHSKGLKTLGRTLNASLRELALLFFFLLIGIILFSSAIYFSELNQSPNKYTSIPASFWWAVITLTTVGYGDIVPIGVTGKIIGAMCAVTGVLTIALPVPVIVSNFNYFYHREKVNEFKSDAYDSNHVQECPFRPVCGCGKKILLDDAAAVDPAKLYDNMRNRRGGYNSVPLQHSAPVMAAQEKKSPRE